MHIFFTMLTSLFLVEIFPHSVLYNIGPKLPLFNFPGPYFD